MSGAAVFVGGEMFDGKDSMCRSKQREVLMVVNQSYKYICRSMDIPEGGREFIDNDLYLLE